jgi:DNA-binding LytR/AlgR family response regulator
MTNTNCLILPNKSRKAEKIPLEEILYLEANLNYTIIHLKDGKVKLSAHTLLHHVNNYLDESFIRIHRAFCVNKNHIESFDKPQLPKYLLLNGGTKLTISRRQRKKIIRL